MTDHLFKTKKMNGFIGGLGLRPNHYSDILSRIENKSVDSHISKWFEVITENYMESEGRPLEKLLTIRSHYPIAMHGVSLSIGSPDPVNIEYLKKVRELANKVEPFIISDHVCWTSMSGHNTHDLLPLLYTQETLHRLTEKIDSVQNYLGRKILLENPSTYVSFKSNEMSEWEFLNEMVLRSGCGLLLDINNIYVSSFNFGWNPEKYLAGLPLQSVGQIHMAGYTDMEHYLIDTHSTPVSEQVWNLYKKTVSTLKHVPTMIEWDDDIPSFDAYENELKKAFHIWKTNERTEQVPAIL